jgi:predicted  nucleic acid-binding Zn-ribbon protein
MDKEELTKIVEIEQRSKSNTKRLDEHDADIKELQNTYKIMEKMDFRIENVESNMTEIKTDIKDIKDKPAKNWDKLVGIIITRNCNSSFRLFFR